MITGIPELTLVIAGISIAVAIGSGVSRRLLTNVEETKRISKEVSTYQKELRQAMMKKDKTKETKLKKKQAQMRRMQGKLARDNMKPMFAFFIPLMLIWWVGLPALVGPNWTSLAAASSPVSLNILPFWPLNSVTAESVTESGTVIVNSVSVFVWYMLASFSFQGVVSKILRLT